MISSKNKMGVSLKVIISSFHSIQRGILAFFIVKRQQRTISHQKSRKNEKKIFGHFWAPSGTPLGAPKGGLKKEFQNLPKTDQIIAYEEYLAQI